MFFALFLCVTSAALAKSTAYDTIIYVSPSWAIPPSYIYFTLRCDSGSTDNPCISKDTKAVCSDIAGDGYKCKCSTKQYSGKNCEKSWCDSNSTNNPCISKDSKAECIDIDGGGYKCACSSQQYSGENCEKSWYV